VIYRDVGFLDCAFDLFDTHRLQLVLDCTSAIANSHTRQFTINALSLLGLLSFKSPLVPASNGGRTSFLGS
jgi:hypothetical protein